MKGFNILINAVHKLATDIRRILIDAKKKKSFDKVQCPFMIKSPKKQGIGETYLNTIKGMWQTSRPH